jgi:RNA polymerase sigma-70 factor (ECF subfamily)
MMNLAIAGNYVPVVEPALVTGIGAHRDSHSWTGFVERAAQGDQSAMADLYDATCSLVFSMALRILGDRGIAEDAVIEVYAQAWREAGGYDSTRGTVGAWLLNLTRSRSIDMLRMRRHERTTDPIEAAAEVVDARPGPDAETAALERRRYVSSALDELGVEQREAIELAYFAGLSHSEIAARLGQPLGTVKTRIRLGMTKLRQLLDHLEAHGPSEGMA